MAAVTILIFLQYLYFEYLKYIFTLYIYNMCAVYILTQNKNIVKKIRLVTAMHRNGPLPQVFTVWKLNLPVAMSF